MKHIPFKTKPRFAGPLDPFGNPKYFETRRHKENFVQIIQPGRGLSRYEMSQLPKGITIVSKK